MSNKTFILIASAIFFLIALGHLLRVIFGLHWRVGGLVVPMGVSWAAAVVTSYLAYSGFKLNKR